MQIAPLICDIHSLYHGNILFLQGYKCLLSFDFILVVSGCVSNYCALGCPVCVLE